MKPASDLKAVWGLWGRHEEITLELRLILLVPDAGTGLVGAFPLNDPIAARVHFSGCMIPTMAPSEQQRESLNIQLLVDSIPALIHTAGPDGFIDYFNGPGLDYLGATLDDVTGWKSVRQWRVDKRRHTKFRSLLS